jgi:Fe-S-cluster containining protein
MPRIADSLPVLYHGLLPPLLRGEVPQESKATCSSCAMCESSCQSPVESVDGASRFFRPDTKCCTYHPRMPNYLVGAVLADTRPELAEGRRRMQERIASRVGITPQWLKPPARYTLLYTSARQAFGRASTLLCPFYEKQQGNCTVWPYREAVCSTFFCKYVAGADGRKFWMSLKTYLSLMEIQLSRWSALQLCPDYVLSGRDRAEAAGSPLTPEDLDGRGLPEREYAALWHQWVGREEEYYRACFEAVSGVSAAQLEQLLGLDGTIELKVLERLYSQAVSPRLPRVLKFNPGATVKWMPDGSVALGAYSENDAVALPGAAYGLLVEFTGREPVQVVRERLRQEKQADLMEDVLLVLHQHRILVDAEAPEPG